MQTLLDPFEVHFPPPPVKAVVEVEVPIPIEVKSEEELAAPSVPRSPDSSGRLRCWCSEE